MMSILKVSLISVAIYLAVAQVCLCAHPLSKEENLKTLVQLRNDIQDLSGAERCDRYQDALRSVLNINRDKFGGKKFLTRAMDALSSYGGNFNGIRPVLDDLKKCISNQVVEDKTVGEDKTGGSSSSSSTDGSEDQPQLEKVQGLGSALKAAQNLGILDDGHGRHGAGYGPMGRGHMGGYNDHGMGYDKYSEHGLDMHGRHRDFGYHDEHHQAGHLGYGHGGAYHDKHHDMGYHGKHNNVGYHSDHLGGAYYDEGHGAGMYHEKQHGLGYHNKHNNFGYHGEHGAGLYGGHGVGHYGAEHYGAEHYGGLHGKQHNKHHYGGYNSHGAGLHGVGKTLKYTSAIEMAKIFYNYLNLNEPVANRCYKYYLLFSYPGQVSKKTIKTVAKLQVRVRNTEMLATMVDLHYLHKFEQAAHMLAGTSTDFIRSLGKEMQICLADLESYRHSYGGVHMSHGGHMAGHGYYEGSHMSHGGHHGAHVLPAVSTSATTATAAAGAASASAASASG